MNISRLSSILHLAAPLDWRIVTLVGAHMREIDSTSVLVLVASCQLYPTSIPLRPPTYIPIMSLYYYFTSDRLIRLSSPVELLGSSTRCGCVVLFPKSWWLHSIRELDRRGFDLHEGTNLAAHISNMSPF
jgi:hypothetical protein